MIVSHKMSIIMNRKHVYSLTCKCLTSGSIFQGVVRRELKCLFMKESQVHIHARIASWMFHTGTTILMFHAKRKNLITFLKNSKILKTCKLHFYLREIEFFKQGGIVVSKFLKNKKKIVKENSISGLSS
jgi:hypothetical protein